MMENVIIFSLLFSFKNNEENKRESWEKFIGFFTAHPPAPVSLSLQNWIQKHDLFICIFLIVIFKTSQPVSHHFTILYKQARHQSHSHCNGDKARVICNFYAFLVIFLFHPIGFWLRRRQLVVRQNAISGTMQVLHEPWWAQVQCAQAEVRVPKDGYGGGHGASPHRAEPQQVAGVQVPQRAREGCMGWLLEAVSRHHSTTQPNPGPCNQVHRLWPANLAQHSLDF